jgi:hypothetical protein
MSLGGFIYNIDIKKQYLICILTNRMNTSSNPTRRRSSSGSSSSLSSLLSSDFGNESENITLSNKIVYRRRSKDKPLNEPLSRTPTPTRFLRMLEQNKSYITELFRERQQGAESCLVKKGKRKSEEWKEQDE